jgi:predicted O-linked N-acetylglucosamine transferase (SPINDLY family)
MSDPHSAADPVLQQALQETLASAVQHHQAGRLPQAEMLYRQILQQDPRNPDALHLLGSIAFQFGRHDAAIDLYQQAIAVRPDFPHAISNLGNALASTGLVDQAMDAQRRAIASMPELPEAHYNLGVLLSARRQYDDSIASYRKAVALRPAYVEALVNLGSDLKDTGRLDESLALQRKAVELNPYSHQAHSNLVNNLHFHPDQDAKSIAIELQLWNNRHGKPLKKFMQPHPNDRTPDRRLRVGYVSADFAGHASVYFLVPLLRSHNREQVEVFCYSDAARTDQYTALMQSFGHVWRTAHGLADEALIKQIRHDKIDILVDLKLHTERNRLLLFARKPAPVQATWLGYPGSTGLATIDYRVSDPYLDPAGGGDGCGGGDEKFYSEKTVRLPDTYWCFDPLEGREIPVGPLPANDAGIVTFGCLNNFCKINPPLLALWAKVLRQVGHSRLRLLAPAGSHRQEALDRFARDGIASERIEFVPPQARDAYLRAYQRIDIGLDSFPCNGHTTSLDSFWMGVPVVSMIGRTSVGRAGWCQLSNLGLAELAGKTPDEFVQIAVALANDLPRLALLRAGLRERMEKSPLMDGPRFARNMEAAYRQMWHNWCSPARR